MKDQRHDGPVTHLPLFAGLNGFGVAADQLGWEQIAHCEIDPFCQHIINHYWPNSIQHDDITKTDFTIYEGRVDVLSGGFPCQPFSHAGNRKGTEDGRYLWPQMLRAIRECKPVAVVGENVTGLITMEEREVFARVDNRNRIRYEDYDHYEAIYTRQADLLLNRICEDLEQEGYAVQPFIIPAAGVGAPHRRDRIWIVGYSEHYGSLRSRNIRDFQGKPAREKKEIEQPDLSGCYESNITCNTCIKHDGRCIPAESRGKGMEVERDIVDKTRRIKSSNNIESSGNDAPNPCCMQLQRSKHHRSVGKERSIEGESGQLGGPVRDFWQNFPTVPPVCNGDDGITSRLDAEAVLKARARKVNSYWKPFNFWRQESIKAGGNAIVWQVAHEIFKAINQRIKHR